MGTISHQGPSPGPSPSPPPAGCTDQPENWKSSEGDSCSVYVSYQYCTPDGREGRGWNHQQWGPITNYADSQGRSALDACCGCCGGNDVPSPVPPPSPSGCADQPENWKSSEGESCSVYVSHQYCTPDGREGRGWNHQQWGPITNYADSHGRSALDACCGCGGGNDGPSPVPPPSPSGCADQPENWKSSEGESCSVYVSHQYCTP